MRGFGDSINNKKSDLRLLFIDTRLVYGRLPRYPQEPLYFPNNEENRHRTRNCSCRTPNKNINEKIERVLSEVKTHVLSVFPRDQKVVEAVFSSSKHLQTLRLAALQIISQALKEQTSQGLDDQARGEWVSIEHALFEWLRRDEEGVEFVQKKNDYGTSIVDLPKAQFLMGLLKRADEQDILAGVVFSGEQAAIAYSLLRKYRRQLQSIGISFDKVIPPLSSKEQDMLGEQFSAQEEAVDQLMDIAETSLQEQPARGKQSPKYFIANNFAKKSEQEQLIDLFYQVLQSAEAAKIFHKVIREMQSRRSFDFESEEKISVFFPLAVPSENIASFPRPDYNRNITKENFRIFKVGNIRAMSEQGNTGDGIIYIDLDTYFYGKDEVKYRKNDGYQMANLLSGQDVDEKDPKASGLSWGNKTRWISRGFLRFFPQREKTDALSFSLWKKLALAVERCTRYLTATKPKLSKDGLNITTDRASFSSEQLLPKYEKQAGDQEVAGIETRFPPLPFVLQSSNNPEVVQESNTLLRDLVETIYSQNMGTGKEIVLPEEFKNEDIDEILDNAISAKFAAAPDVAPFLGDSLYRGDLILVEDRTLADEIRAVIYQVDHFSGKFSPENIKKTYEEFRIEAIEFVTGEAVQDGAVWVKQEIAKVMQAIEKAGGFLRLRDYFIPSVDDATDEQEKRERERRASSKSRRDPEIDQAIERLYMVERVLFYKMQRHLKPIHPFLSYGQFPFVEKQQAGEPKKNNSIWLQLLQGDFLFDLGGKLLTNPKRLHSAFTTRSGSIVREGLYQASSIYPSLAIYSDNPMDLVPEEPPVNSDYSGIFLGGLCLNVKPVAFIFADFSAIQAAAVKGKSLFDSGLLTKKEHQILSSNQHFLSTPDRYDNAALKRKNALEHLYYIKLFAHLNALGIPIRRGQESGRKGKVVSTAKSISRQETEDS